MAEETMTAKDAMEAVRVLNEMMTMFKGSEAKLGEILPKFVEAARGNGVAMFEGMGLVGDLDLDDSQGALIVALTVIARVKAAVKGTPCEQAVRHAMNPKDEQNSDGSDGQDTEG